VVTHIAFHYLFEHEVDGSDAEHLIDALEDEEFPIREELGERAMVHAIREGLLSFDRESDQQLHWFPKCLETLSVHLSEYITGLEIAEGRNQAGIRVEIEIRKYVARRGEVIAVPLDHQVDIKTGEIDPLSENLAYLTANWNTLPRWAQDAYRLKFPELRRL
jgi:hypothetical protein